MRQKTLSFCLPVIICIILLSCSKKEGPSDQVEVHHDIIAAHTSAVISCDDPIRVRFVKNMVPAERIDTTIDKPPIKFEPTIKGTAVWSGANMLEFRPANRLPQNMAYTATVLLSELVELVDNVPTAFSFDFKTMEQAFEVTIDGLQPYPKDPSLQTLGGKISTADTADNESVEKILSSFQGEKALSINWVHAPNRKNHAFIISDIQRKDKASEVSIQWDGSAIQVDKKGQRFIDVPAVSTFAILKVRPIQGKTQYVEIQFSDPLDTRQDLNGLIAVTDYNNLKLEIDKNIIRVYSSKNWPDKIAIEIRNGIRNAMGYKLEQPQAFQVFFGEQKPEIRFTGKGVIFPTHTKSTIPVETMNLRAVIVQATRIHEQNIPQFLQVNTMEGWSQLNRVGRVVWEKTVPLDVNESQKNEWVRHGLDISPLINQNPGGIYQITLSFDPRHTMYNCPDLKNNIEMIAEPQPQAEWQEDDEESSFWDYYEADEGYSWTSYYENRMNPCHPAFYRQYYDHNIKVSRNVFVSDIGLIAKAGSNGDLFVAVTDIRTTEPLSGVALEILDFQQEVIARAKTSKDGTVTVPCDRKPFLVIARKADQTGYLKMDDGSSLSTSHFDVAGETISNGVKGFIYGERGVWRPGDDIYLTFILLDTTGRLPENHPVIFQFRNPKGQLIQTIKKTESDNGFYTLTLHTDQDAPTGNWKVSVRVGGATFEKALRVETVMPNRLKINLDFGDATKSLYGKHIAGKLSSTWLHGAIAKNLKANIKLKLTEGKTVFPKYEAYVFDDPSRLYDPEEQDIFEGTLDEHGKVSFIANIQTQNVSPGMLMANFTTRVFEPGGAFSTDIYSAPYHPYDRYIGILTPKGDKTRGMLLTDTPHKVLIAAVDREGKPVPNGNVDVELYKIKWRWWWEKGAESIAEYIGTSSYRPIQKESLKIKDGQAEWTLEVKYPEWGRYLIRAKDAEGKHAAGKIVYIDWPGWAGRSTENNPGGAAVLTFTSDKDRYDVGEQAVVTIPTGKEGRGLVSFETGTKVLKTDWFEATGEEAVQYKFTATADMAPTVYVHVTYLQPHLQTKNDLPIRMYGVIPVNVVNPETRLKPEIVSGEVFKPEDTAVIKIKEASGKPMTYTLAIVDVGLLDLTRFTTPDPWSSFFKREALGIKTWDMFNFVAGAYGGTLENILAIGGDDVALDGKKKKANRFPPMVRFLGPFDLGPGKTATHVIDIPQYIGAVRVMAVAGRKNAFGSAEKTVVVRKPLMLLGTLPRVLGPNEEVELPVSVFALEDHVKDVSVSVKTNDMLSVKGQSTKTLAFNQPGDDIIFFKIKVGDRQGVASVFIKAAAGGESAEQRVDLDIRMPGGPVVDVVQSSLSPGKSWRQDISLPGIAGTNKALLEVSRIPPIDLGKRISYLIRYPHGCVEQTTSSVFPQLYLGKLLALSPEKQQEIQKNISAGIERLKLFQAIGGGFSYWPGSHESDDWASSYAGHFIVEADKAGYLVPGDMMQEWISYQSEAARNWVAGPPRAELAQAYRLYTLALANHPELGAMNRLREEKTLPAAARWRLAAAYQLAGQPEAAEDIVRNASMDISDYYELSNTYGSHIRDKAMILESLCLMGKMKKAEPVVQEVSEHLRGDTVYSTQTTAYALIAIARYAGITSSPRDMQFEVAWNKSATQRVTSSSPIIQRELTADNLTKGSILINNTGETMLFPRLILEGIPPVGSENAASNGLVLNALYTDLEGKPIEPYALEQGTDFMASVTVKNTGKRGRYEEIALSQLFPSGWEIHNVRMNAPAAEIARSPLDYQDIRDDRIYTYFDINQGDAKVFEVLLNASYLGKFYMPMVYAEAMYDPTINARVPGRWIQVIKPGGKSDRPDKTGNPE